MVVMKYTSSTPSKKCHFDSTESIVFFHSLQPQPLVHLLLIKKSLSYTQTDTDTDATQTHNDSGESFSDASQQHRKNASPPHQHHPSQHKNTKQPFLPRNPRAHCQGEEERWSKLSLCALFFRKRKKEREKKKRKLKKYYANASPPSHAPSPSPPSSLTHVHRCIGDRNPHCQSLSYSARLTYPSVYDRRDGESESEPSPSSPSSLTDVHRCIGYHNPH